MALDVELQIVDSAVVDVSEGASQASTAVNLGKKALVRGATFVVDIEDVSAAGPFRFDFEYTVDNGVNWYKIASVTTKGDVKVRRSARIGPVDARIEKQTAASVNCRVVCNYTDGVSTDDMTYSAYIAGPHNEAPFDF